MVYDKKEQPANAKQDENQSQSFEKQRNMQAGTGQKMRYWFCLLLVPTPMGVIRK